MLPSPLPSPGRTACPLGRFDGNHHPPVRGRYLLGQIVAGEFRQQRRVTVRATHARLDRAEHVVGRQGNAEGKQSRLRVTQGVDLAPQCLVDFLERVFDAPPTAVKLSQGDRIGRFRWHVRDQVNHRLVVTRGFVQLNGDPPHAHQPPLGIWSSGLLISISCS